MLLGDMHDNYILRICYHQCILPSSTDQPVLLGNFIFLPTNASLHIYAAHVKASMMGSSLTIPITSGRFNLGIWQVLSFCVFVILKPSISWLPAIFRTSHTHISQKTLQYQGSQKDCRETSILMVMQNTYCASSCLDIHLKKETPIPPSVN